MSGPASGEADPAPTPGEKPVTGYHDIGGSPAGAVPMLDPAWIEWEKRVEAIRNLLGDSTRRLVSLDEMRRGFESFGIDRYRSLSFYRRRLEAMVDILIEKGVLQDGELEAKVASLPDPAP